MTWIFRLIGGTLAAALGALLVMMFQGQVVRYFDPDRLVAEVHAGAWMPVLGVSNDEDKHLERQGLSSYAVGKIQSGKMLSFVRIDIKNPGAKEITKFRIDVSQLGAVAFSVYRDGKELPRADDTVVQLAPIEPGDSASILVWSVLDETLLPYAMSSLETFSSEGSLVIHYHGPQEITYGDGTDDLLGSILGWLFGISVALALVLMLIGLGIYWNYVRQLMKDEDWYLSERSRFDENPKKFTMKLKPE